jgi:hypothetical protein
LTHAILLTTAILFTIFVGSFAVGWWIGAMIEFFNERSSHMPRPGILSLRPRLGGWVVIIAMFWVGFAIGHHSNVSIEQQIERDCTTYGQTMINGEPRACAFVKPTSNEKASAT